MVFDDIKENLDEHNFILLKKDLAACTVEQIVTAMGRVSHGDRAIIFRLLNKQQALLVFETLDPRLASELAQNLRDDRVIELFENLDPDDRVYLLDELPANIAKRVMSGISPKERAYTAQLLGYPDDSIGRRMSPEYVRAYPEWTCGETLDYIRQRGMDAETVYVIPVIDHKRILVGVLSLRDVLVNDPQQCVEEIMNEPFSVFATTEEEEAARRLVTSGFIAVPVVDSEKRLLGIFTVDDAADIISKAEDEDAARAGGAEPLRQPYLSVPVIRIVRSRIVWLLMLAISATLTVSVLDSFQDILGTIIVLTIFIPLITGTGGNTGSQAASTVTRALALGDVEKKDIFRVAFREMLVGVSLGLMLAVIGFFPTYVFSKDMHVAFIVSVTLFLVCVLSASVGGIMPLIAKAIKVDPAVFSTPFISTFCDASALLIYFYIAKLVLGI